MLKILIVSIIVFTSSTLVKAQLFSEQGMMSGSGLMLIPTATTTPSSEMQVQYSRFSILRENSKSLNVFGINCGFSPVLEGYVRLTSEEIQTVASQVSYSFGGKFRFPEKLPIVDKLAFWFESTTSDLNSQGKPTLFPVRAVRGAMTASVDFERGYPAFILGATEINSTVSPLIGAGSLHSFGHDAQLGVEFIYGYYGEKSYHTSLEGSLRFFSNLSVNLSPGYMLSGSTHAWMISVGISLSTADIDYLQMKNTEVNKDEFIMPSIDDLEKQSNEEKQ